MILSPSPKIPVEYWLQKAHYVVWGLMVLVPIGFGLLLSFGPSEQFLDLQIPRALPELEKGYMAYEEIGKGPLALSQMKKSCLIPDLSKEIQVLARNTRPDCRGRDISILLAVKESGQQLIARNGEQIFLSYEKKSGKDALVYSFSDRQTPLWIKPVLLDNNEIFLEVGLLMPSKETEIFVEEKAQFLLQQTKAALKEKRESPFLSCIKQAKWWGCDSLLMNYGGSEYGDIKEKQKIEIPSTSSFYFVSEGDCLFWKEGRWEVASLDGGPKSSAIAQIKKISPRQMEIEVWDEKGFYPFSFKLELQVPVKAGVKSDALPSAVRMRSSSQITCNLGKRRYILKEGDWMLKTAKGWRNLKKAKDIDDCVMHKIRGDLFIFDALEKQQGKLTLKGHWFDEMRTQAVPVNIPLQGETVHAKKEKRSSLFKSSRAAASTASLVGGAV